jgi:hypothetical protein
LAAAIVKLLRNTEKSGIKAVQIIYYRLKRPLSQQKKQIVLSRKGVAWTVVSLL